MRILAFLEEGGNIHTCLGRMGDEDRMMVMRNEDSEMFVEIVVRVVLERRVGKCVVSGRKGNNNKGRK